jgi:murein DD-endopeptidase MepM/ murein hydrolase activator NlpD
MSSLYRGAGLIVALLASYWPTAAAPQTAPSARPHMLAQYGGHIGGGIYGGKFGGSGGFGQGPMGRRFQGKQQARRHSFPHGCHAVCSGFGARTRCDGGLRSPRYPIHNGVDVAVPVGTPVLAIADGVVVKSGRGPSIGGIGLVLRHPPKATGGSSTYTYSFYKHLREPSPLPPGTHVRRGQKVASSGKSGTIGGYFGGEGFAELHVEIWTDGTANWPSGHLTNPVSFLRRTRGHTGWFCR